MEREELKKVAHDLLVSHPSRGVKPSALTEVLQSLDITELEHGTLLCSEGEPGDSMYFLLFGSILVTRKDANGEDRELVTMSAPALLGHMALVDNSPRSATCRAAGTTRVALLDRRLYNTMLSVSSSRGTALRRMLLTSLTRQLENATGRLRRLISGETSQADMPAPEKKANTEQELNKITGMLNGWTDEQVKAADEVEVVYDENQKAAQRERNRRR